MVRCDLRPASVRLTWALPLLELKLTARDRACGLCRDDNLAIVDGNRGPVIAVLWFATPALVLLLAAVGLSALTGYLDYVLLPAIAIFVGIVIYALWRRRAA